VLETDTAPLRAELLEDGRILRLVLDAGKGNVIDAALVARMRDTIASAAESTALCALIIDHAGPHFSFGASVAEHTPDKVGNMLPGLHGLARELIALDVPILIAARGMVLGGGLEVLLLGDLVFAAPGAKFGQPEIQLGVFAPLGSALLPVRIGEQAAADLLLSGRSIDATEACELGLVRALDDDPGAACLAWATKHLAPKSASSLRLATRALRARTRPRFNEVLDELEDLYLQDLMETHDAVEGIQAFLEKRPAKWEDR